MLALALLVAMSVSDPAGAAQGAASPERIVALGTSLTARGGWPQALEKRLQTCLGTGTVIRPVAKAGATSEWALAQLEKVVAEEPQVVLIEFYANDAALNRWISIGQSRQNFARLLDGLAQKLPQARIVVMGMNPVFGLRGWMRPFLRSYMAAHRQEAEQRGLAYIDFGPAWRSLPDSALSAAISDGLHPDAQTSAKIIVPQLATLIAGKACGYHDGLSGPPP